MSTEQNPYAIIHIPRHFPHVRFAFANTALIFLFYQLSMMVVLMLIGGADGGVSVWVQGSGHILFMLMPAVLVMSQSPLGRRVLQRSEGDVSAVQWVLGLAGILPLFLVGSGWMILQETLLPDSWMPLYHKLQDASDKLYESLLVGRSTVAVFGAYLVGAVIPAFAEEYLFRGLMQRSLEEVWPPARAIITTAVVFGVVHFNPVALLPLIALGAYFGLLAWYTRSLALPVVAHFFNNAISITSLNIMAREPQQAMAAEAHWWQGAFMMISGLAILSFILVRLFATRRLTRSRQWKQYPV